MTTQTFATSDDVAARWRPLSPDEGRLANTLCEDASRRVRKRWQTIDARITAGTLDVGDVRMVVAGVVKRAMLNSAAEGVASMTDSGGIYSQSVTYVNPTANLFFTKEDAQVLALGSRRVRSIVLTNVNTSIG